MTRRRRTGCTPRAPRIRNRAASIKLRAAAKGGAMLDANPELGKGKSARLADLFPVLSPDAAQHLSSRWQRVAHLAGLGTLAAYLASVADADGEISMAGLLHYATVGTLTRSASPEWYTPARYVEAARDVLGGIDLDPASCAEANRVVGAAHYYTAQTDGLAHPWPGRVFLNPPYGKSAPKGTAVFVPKLAAEYEVGRTTAAILLTSAHGTETDWFAFLWDQTICFTDHRLDYWNPDPVEGGPTFGSAFTYFGPEPARFARRFAEFGAIVQRVKVA